jgi:TonB family protein
MRTLLPIVVLFAACASQPGQPASAQLDPCDSALPQVGLVQGAGDVKAPKVIRKVDPQVPNFYGTQIVEVETIIDETGRVTGVCDVKGEPGLVTAVLSAVRQWSFEPATLDGKPVKVRFRITTQFHR